MKTKPVKQKNPPRDVVVKVPLNRQQRDWLIQKVGRGNVSEYIRSKTFNEDYDRNSQLAMRYRWELAVALTWVGNNLQSLTEKTDKLADQFSNKKPETTELLALTSILELLQTSALTLIEISRSLAGMANEDDSQN